MHVRMYQCTMAVSIMASSFCRPRVSGTVPILTYFLKASGPAMNGIGGFFDTRKGQFRYKISLYIIIYHVAIMIYHCVSSSVSWYIMFLVDTWYIDISSFFPLHVISFDIMSISCRVFDDIWTWYRHMIYDDIWWYIAKFKPRTPRRPPSPTLHDIAWYHMISCPPNTAQAPGTQTVISCYIMSYHVISLIVIYNDITWYHMILVFKNIDMSPRYRMI